MLASTGDPAGWLSFYLALGLAFIAFCTFMLRTFIGKRLNQQDNRIERIERSTTTMAIGQARIEGYLAANNGGAGYRLPENPVSEKVREVVADGEPVEIAGV